MMTTDGRLATRREWRRRIRVVVGAAGILAVAGLLGSSAAEAADATAWTATGGLEVARDFATATVLRNGKVLVAGGMRAKGTAAGGYLASAELYNPRTGRWSATKPMLQSRVHHTATLLRNGKVLVAGGYGFGGFRRSAELYDPATKRWRATGHMAIPRDEHTATVLRNGQVLVAGGDDDGVALASAELYHPKTGKWSRAAKFGGARYSHVATRLPDGHVLIAGGYNAHTAVASARLYAPATGKWSTTGSMTGPRFRQTATLLTDGRVLVAGGARNTTSRGYLSSAELYDPATKAWSATGGAGEARYLATATRLPDGRVLVAGGRGGPGYLSSAELYDPTAGSWSAPTITAAGRFRHTASLLRNGTVLVAGGYGAGGPLRGAELYHPQPAVLPGPGTPPLGVPPLMLGPLDHLSLSPAAATVGTSVNQAYRVEGFDAAGHDLGDVTAASTLSIAPDGACDNVAHTCTSAVDDTTGHHTVTASDGRATGTATLTITPPAHATTLTGSDQTGYCAVLASGGVACWGTGGSPVPMHGVGGTGLLSGVTSLAGDSGGYCALLASGGVDCWTAGDVVPTALPGPDGTGTLSGVKRLVSDGQSSYCALLTSGGVDCWGDNGAGELGNGTPTAFSSATPVAVVGVGGGGALSGVSSLTATYHAYCAILTSTGLVCWGYNNHGELGTGNVGGPESCGNGLSCSSSPVRVIGLGGNGLMSGVLSLASTGSAGSAGSICAVLDANGLACWGWNYVVGGSQFDPSPVGGLGGAVVKNVVGNLAVSRGTMDGSYCAILKSGAADCWRRGTEGQLGDGHASNTTIVVDDPQGSHFHDVPVPVSGTGGAGRLSVARMVAGQESFCAVLTSGGVDCWGANVRGNLGNGSMTGPDTCQGSQPCSTVPRAVKGIAGNGTLKNAVSVASDGASYCAVRASGEVDCWGQNSSGQLGNGSVIDSAVPVVALPGS